MVVHNHEPWRGPGPDGLCSEKVVNGKLRGQCMPEDLRYTSEKVFKCSIDFTEEELGELVRILARSKLWRGSKEFLLPLETRLGKIVDELL
ncbi:hypothetical protein PBI_GRAYSON_16 [Rhodococcus phage Grayson]|nr:hypothetical protein PBI_GRAYSON_16 [Rhodococcus phage Grayson]